jgi:hypothetical protein
MRAQRESMAAEHISVACGRFIGLAEALLL